MDEFGGVRGRKIDFPARRRRPRIECDVMVMVENHTHKNTSTVVNEKGSAVKDVWACVY